MKPSSVYLALTFTAAMPLSACGEDDPPRSPSVVAHWSSGSGDPLLPFILATPAAVERHLAQLELCPSLGAFGAETVITSVELEGTPLGLGPPPPGSAPACITLPAIRPHTRPSAPLQVIVQEPGAALRRIEVAIPAFPGPPESAVFALDMLRIGELTWLATPHHGLVGLAADGRVIRYPGVLSSAPWDPAAREPQSGLVLALAPAGSRALWLSSAVTGVSWFDPGTDPWSTSDDTWLHGQPTGGPPLAAELAQTGVDLAPDPLDPDRLWVASLNGLHRVTRSGSALVFELVANGAALAVSVAPDGRVWAGFSTQVAFEVPVDDSEGALEVSLPVAEGALLTLTSDDMTPRWALEDEDAVTALLADGAGVWVGTPHGLGRVTLADTLTLAPVAGVTLDEDAAVVDLEATTTGFWLAARGECEVGTGALVAVTLEDGAIASAVDKSALGFGERDFTRVRALPAGGALVSTLVPSLQAITGEHPDTARGCLTPKPGDRTADAYELSPSGRTRRLP